MTENIEVSQDNQEVTQEVAPINNETSQNDNPFGNIEDQEVKTYIEKAGYKDIQGLAKSAMHLEKKLGAPKEPEKYEAEAYTYELPENYEANNKIIDSIKEKALELGVKPEVFKTFVETFANEEKSILDSIREEQRAEYQAQLDEEVKYLKEKTKLAPNEIIEKSAGILNSFVDPRYKDIFNNLDQGTQLYIADIMNNVASKISEGSIGKQQNLSLTKSEAQNKLDMIYNDPNHPYFTGDSQTRQAIGREIANLQALV